MLVEQLGIQEVGENEAEAPEGNPNTVNDPTGGTVPEAKVKVTLEVLVEPGVTDRLVQEVLYEPPQVGSDWLQAPDT